MVYTCQVGWLLFMLVSAGPMVVPAAASQQDVSPAQAHSSVQEAKSALSEGLKYLDQARYPQAIAAFRKALELDAHLTNARYDLGVACFSSGQFDEARQAFQQVLRDNPRQAFSLYVLSRLDLVEDNLDAAIGGFQLLLKQNPVADELYYLGSAYFRKGNMEEAFRVLQQAATQKPNDYRIPLLLARAYQKTGQDAKAAEQATLSEKLRDSYRRKSQEILDCTVALNSQPLESAVQRCQQLLDGADSTKLVTLGVLLAERQLFDQAIPPLAKACRLDPENYEPHFNLGLTYFRMKNYQQAKKPLEMAVSLRPESYDALALLGSTLFALGDDYAAVQHLRHAHQLRPAEEKVTSLLLEQLRIIAHHLFDGQDYEQSVAYLQEALSLKPDEPELRSQLAQATAALRNNKPPRHQDTKKSN
jgi:tetratricopeptide (TPR) repeat protein